MELRDYILVLHFDNQQEYSVRLQLPQLTASQVDGILSSVLRGTNNLQGIMVNPQRILFVRLIELAPVRQETPSSEGVEVSEARD